MGGGNSKSNSKSTTTTTTQTEQYDQRVAATDAAVAVGPNSQNIEITNVPPVVGEVVQGLINLTAAAGQQAFESNQKLLDKTEVSQQAATSQANSLSQLLIIGLGGLAVLAFFTRKGRSNA